ncbi:MAG: quercetin 2,3-dioxygenase [Frankiales bacterium]|nr:quercetin 2,3-dioxygenase [Frankiales bacterium]
MVSNHDTLGPGAGFGDHWHSDVDIVTFVVAGTLAHADSTGHQELLGPADLQVLRSGAGVGHSERNASATEPVEYVQMWVRSTDPEVSYERASGSVAVSGGVLSVVGLDPGGAFSLPAEGLQHAYLVSGSVVLADGLRLAAGDALSLARAPLDLVAETPSRLLAWRLRIG